MQKLEPAEIAGESTLLLTGWTVFLGFHCAVIFCLYLDEGTPAPPLMVHPIPVEKGEDFFFLPWSIP